MIGPTARTRKQGWIVQNPGKGLALKGLKKRHRRDPFVPAKRRGTTWKGAGGRVMVLGPQHMAVVRHNDSNAAPARASTAGPGDDPVAGRQ